MKKLFILSLIIPFSITLSACGKSENKTQTQKEEARVNIAKHSSQTTSQIKAQEQQLLAHPDNGTIKDDGKNLISNGF